MSLFIGTSFIGLGDLLVVKAASGNNATILLAYESIGSKLIYKEAGGMWEYLTTPFTNPLSVEFCFDRFLVSTSNKVYYSFDGFNWVQVIAQGITGNYAFGYIKGKYVLYNTLEPTNVSIITTTDFITFNTATLPIVPIGFMHSFANVLAFIPVSGVHNNTATLVYTLDGVTWLYKTTDTLYTFLPYDFSEPYIPTRSRKNIPTAFEYKSKWFNNNLLSPDGIVDCNVYTYIMYDVPQPSSSDFFIFNGADIIMLNAYLNLYALNKVGYTYIGNLSTIITSYTLIYDFKYINNTYYIYGTGFCIYSTDLVVWDSVSIGVPTGLKKSLIATRESKSLVDIKNTSPRDCEFHSDLPYINIKIYEAESIIDADILYYSGYIYDFYSGHTYGCVTAKFPDEFYLNYSDRLIIVTANDIELSKAFRTLGLRNGSVNDIPGSVGHKWVDTNFSPSPGITYAWNQSTVKLAPLSTHKNLLIPKIASTSNRNISQPYTIPSVKLLVITNVKKDGTFIPYYTDNSGIKITSNSIYINGYDLYNTKYLSNLALNPNDTEINTEGGYVYVIGDVPSTETGMQLISRPYLGTKILKGNSILFDTLYGKRGTYLDAKIISNTYNFSAYYGNFDTYTYEIFSIASNLLNTNKELNVLLEFSITSTNVKHNETIDVIASPDWVYYNITKSFGSMFITLRDSTQLCIGVDEYYYYVFNPSQNKNFRFCECYIQKAEVGTNTKVKLICNTNVGYTNPSANISVNIKARILI